MDSIKQSYKASVAESFTYYFTVFLENKPDNVSHELISKWIQSRKLEEKDDQDTAAKLFAEQLIQHFNYDTEHVALFLKDLLEQLVAGSMIHQNDLDSLELGIKVLTCSTIKYLKKVYKIEKVPSDFEKKTIDAFVNVWKQNFNFVTCDTKSIAPTNLLKMEILLRDMELIKKHEPKQDYSCFKNTLTQTTQDEQEDVLYRLIVGYMCADNKDLSSTVDTYIYLLISNNLCYELLNFLIIKNQMIKPKSWKSIRILLSETQNFYHKMYIVSETGNQLANKVV